MERGSSWRDDQLAVFNVNTNTAIEFEASLLKPSAHEPNPENRPFPERCPVRRLIGPSNGALAGHKANLTNSYIAGVIGGLTYPFALGDTAIAEMGTAGRIAANAYNAGVAGVGAFGAAGMSGNNPDLSGGLAAGLAGTGTYAKAVLPGTLGEFANRLIQGLEGPLQNYIQNNQNPTKK